MIYIVNDFIICSIPLITIWFRYVFFLFTLDTWFHQGGEKTDCNQKFSFFPVGFHRIFLSNIYLIINSRLQYVLWMQKNSFVDLFLWCRYSCLSIFIWSKTFYLIFSMVVVIDRWWSITDLLRAYANLLYVCSPFFLLVSALIIYPFNLYGS